MLLIFSFPFFSFPFFSFLFFSLTALLSYLVGFSMPVLAQDEVEVTRAGQLLGVVNSRGELRAVPIDRVREILEQYNALNWQEEIRN